MSMIFFLASMCVVTLVLAIFSDSLIDTIAPKDMDKLVSQNPRIKI